MKSAITCLGIVIASALALASCVVGPNYKAPTPDLPPTWASTAQGTNSSETTAQTPIAWWNEFRDPALSSLIERAVSANLDVRQSVLRIEEARAQRRVAAAGFWPSVSLSSSYQKQRLSENTQAGALIGVGSAALPNATLLANPFDTFQLGFDASWEIDLFGRVRRSVEAADADTRASLEDAHDALLSMMAEVARMYAELRSAQARLVITQDMLRIQRDFLELTKQRRDVGLTTDLDVENAATLVASSEAQIPQFESLIAVDINQLSRLLGQAPGALQGELQAVGAIPPVPPEVPVGLPADLARRRPDIRRAEARLHAATARIGVATAALFPRFTIGASAGLQSQESSRLTDWASHYYRFGPTLEIPIFNGESWATVRVQDVRTKEAVNDYARTVLQALHEVDNALIAYDREQHRRDSLQVAVTHSESAVQLAEQRYRSGISSFIDVLDAQRTLQQNKLQLAESTTAIATSLIALYKSLGGGWENAQVDERGAVNLHQ
jgi:NodT family efflux transporter outer membrane factor (OMF) lipoprotein